MRISWDVPASFPQQNNCQFLQTRGQRATPSQSSVASADRSSRTSVGTETWLRQVDDCWTGVPGWVGGTKTE